MSIRSTISLLSAWGKWGSAVNLGYPHAAATFGGISTRTPLYAETGAPPEILMVDKAVANLEAENKRLLIERYQWHKMWHEGATSRGWSKATYYRHLEKAHWAVHIAIGG